MKILKILFVTLIVSILCLASSYSSPKDTVTFSINRTETDLYPTNFLNVTIRGREGNILEKLTPSNFEVFENGRPQKVLDIVQSDEKETKVYVALVIDTSGSMTPVMEETKTAAKSFINFLGPEDHASVIGFANFPTVECDFNNDRTTLDSSIDKLTPSGGTALYMSIMETANLFNDFEDGNCAIVVLTDGQNNGMGTLEQAIAICREKGLPVFSIGLGPYTDEPSLERLASETGGFFKLAPTVDDLEEVYKTFARFLKTQLWIKYQASPQRWPKSAINVSARLTDIPGAADEAFIKYRVPMQWWKVVTSYFLIELIIIIFTYFIFRLFWGPMNMDPVVATRLAIVILMILTMTWYSIIFFPFLPIIYFGLIGLGQLLILFIPVKIMAG